jgi:hypothetical protein
MLVSAGCVATVPTRLAGKPDAAAGPGGTRPDAGTPSQPGGTDGDTALRPNAEPGVSPEHQLAGATPEKAAKPGEAPRDPAAATAPIDRYQRLREVADVFTLKNPRLGQISDSVLQVAGVAVTSGLVSNAGGSLISNNGGGIISDHGSGYRVAGMAQGRKQLYRALSDTGLQLVVDPDNDELVAIRSTDVDLGLTFVNQGRTRTWQADVDRATDRSTGSMHVAVTGDWQPLEQDTDPGYKLFQNEVPSKIDRLITKVDFTPAGDTTSRLSVHADATGFGAGAGRTLPGLPAQTTMEATIADLAVKTDTRYAVQAGKAVLTTRSVLKGDVPAGAETLTVDYTLDENTLKQDVTVTSALARVKFTLTTEVRLPDAPDVPLAPLTVPLFSTDDNARLGTVTWDAERATRVTVTLDDGRKLDWELVGEVLEPASTWVTPSPGAVPAVDGRRR